MSFWFQWGLQISIWLLTLRQEMKIRNISRSLKSRGALSPLPDRVLFLGSSLMLAWPDDLTAPMTATRKWAISDRQMAKPATRSHLPSARAADMCIKAPSYGRFPSNVRSPFPQKKTTTKTHVMLHARPWVAYGLFSESLLPSYTFISEVEH